MATGLFASKAINPAGAGLGLMNSGAGVSDFTDARISESEKVFGSTILALAAAATGLVDAGGGVTGVGAGASWNVFTIRLGGGMMVFGTRGEAPGPDAGRGAAVP